MRVPILSVLSAVALLAPPQSTAPPEERIDTFIREEMARQQIPGLAVAVVQKGVVAARGYGYANVEHMVPVTDETIFQSGSLGKMFTAATIMLQVEDGKLALGDSITRFFPDAPAAWKSITAYHLLTHTSLTQGQCNVQRAQCQSA